ncbi:hypothetical protein BDF21DRAFT_493747 [Thamnidium elegans]|nr:hypothetical protein BDF21DRAFT_493747 [Thamnidium elegans]
MSSGAVYSVIQSSETPGFQPVIVVVKSYNLIKSSTLPELSRQLEVLYMVLITKTDRLMEIKISNQETDGQSTRVLAERLNQAIAKFEQATKKSPFIFVEPNSIVYYKFQYNLVEHSNRITTLVTCLEEIEINRTNRRFWFPHLTIRKYFRSTGIKPNMGVQVYKYFLRNASNIYNPSSIR